MAPTQAGLLFLLTDFDRPFVLDRGCEPFQFEKSP
jgi:hypothetical protein